MHITKTIKAILYKLENFLQWMQSHLCCMQYHPKLVTIRPMGMKFKFFPSSFRFSQVSATNDIWNVCRL